MYLLVRRHRHLHIHKHKWRGHWGSVALHWWVSSLLLVVKLLGHCGLLLVLVKLLLEMLLLILLLLLFLSHGSVIVHVEVCSEVVDMDGAWVVAGQGGQRYGNSLGGR